MSTEYIERSTTIINQIEGLELVPYAMRRTPHRYLIDDRTVFAWCASDALTFPVVLGRQGIIQSTCGSTGQPIRIELTPNGVKQVDPPAAVVSAIRPAGEVADVRSAICRHGRFFASPQAAAQWAAEHPEGEIRPVQEAFVVDRAVVTQVGWAAP